MEYRLNPLNFFIPVLGHNQTTPQEKEAAARSRIKYSNGQSGSQLIFKQT